MLAEKRDVRREVSLDEVGARLERSTARLASVLADDAPSPSSRAMQHERAVMLANELAELPPDYRQVLLLRNLEGMSFAEVAEQMQRSAGAVRMFWPWAARTESISAPTSTRWASPCTNC